MHADNNFIKIKQYAASTKYMIFFSFSELAHLFFPFSDAVTESMS